MDREKVISWLEGLAEDDWRECYSDSEVQETARQALNLIDELLKEQEAEKPTWSRGKPFCGACGLQIRSGGKFCSECGKPIAWEGR